MKIEATGVDAATHSSVKNQSAVELGAKNIDTKNVVTKKDSLVTKDTVSLTNTLTSLKEIGSGDYTVSIHQKRLPNILRPMSELKNTADERLKQFGSASDTVESISEINLADDRKDMVEIARLRVKSGFYDRPDVIDEIARRIIEGF